MALPAQRGREKSSDADFFLLQKKIGYGHGQKRFVV